MPLNALRLKRTNIFYPTSGQTPNLRMLLSSLELTPDILQDILDIEDEALSINKRSAQSNELLDLLKVARKQGIATPQIVRRIYLHVLRLNSFPEKCTDDGLEQLRLAYRDLMKELPRGFPAAHAEWLDYLWLFGHTVWRRCTTRPRRVEESIAVV